jgi:hypothetical protein
VVDAEEAEAPHQLIELVAVQVQAHLSNFGIVAGGILLEHLQLVSGQRGLTVETNPKCLR